MINLNQLHKGAQTITAYKGRLFCFDDVARCFLITILDDESMTFSFSLEKKQVTRLRQVMKKGFFVQELGENTVTLVRGTDKLILQANVHDDLDFMDVVRSIDKAREAKGCSVTYSPRDVALMKHALGYVDVKQYASSMRFLVSGNKLYATDQVRLFSADLSVALNEDVSIEITPSLVNGVKSRLRLSYHEDKAYAFSGNAVYLLDTDTFSHALYEKFETACTESASEPMFMSRRFEEMIIDSAKAKEERLTFLYEEGKITLANSFRRAGFKTSREHTPLTFTCEPKALWHLLSFDTGWYKNVQINDTGVFCAKGSDWRLYIAPNKAHHV